MGNFFIVDSLYLALGGTYSCNFGFNFCSHSKDKGGSNEEFVRVAEAYQILTGDAQAKPGSSRSFGGDGGNFNFNMPDDAAKLKMAYEMFSEMLDEFLINTDAMADKVVDWIFDMFAGIETTKDENGRTSYKYNGSSNQQQPQRREEDDTQIQSWVRWGLRKGIKWLQSFLEGDNMQITINGKNYTGADIRKLREQAEQRVRAKKEKSDGDL